MKENKMNKKITFLLLGIIFNLVFFTHIGHSVCVDIHQRESDLNYNFSTRNLLNNRLEYQQNTLLKPITISFFDIEQSIYSHVVLIDASYHPGIKRFQGNWVKPPQKLREKLNPQYLALFDQLNFFIDFNPYTATTPASITIQINNMGDNIFLSCDDTFKFHSTLKNKKCAPGKTLFYSGCHIYKNKDGSFTTDWEIMEDRRKITKHDLIFYPFYYDLSQNTFFYSGPQSDPVIIPNDNCLKSYLDETAADIGFVVRGLEKQASKLNAQDNGFDGIYFLWNRERSRLQKVVVSESKYAAEKKRAKQALLPKFDVSETSALSRMISGNLVLTGAIIQEFILKFPEHIILYGINMKEDGAISGNYGDFYSITSWSREVVNSWIKTQRERRFDFDAFLHDYVERLLPLSQGAVEQLEHAAIIAHEDQIKIDYVIAGNSSGEAVSVAEAKVKIEEKEIKKESLIIATDLKKDFLEVECEYQEPLNTESKVPIPFTPKTSKASDTLASSTSVVSLPLLSPQSSEKEKMDFYYKVILLAMQSTGDSIEQIKEDFTASLIKFNDETDSLENIYQVISNGSFESPIKSQEK